VKRTLVAVALAVFFLLALAAPAFAMFHTATINMDGTINFKSQAGHACNTGGVMKQTIAGNGVLDKVMTVTMVPGKLTVSDTNDWVAGSTPLTVTSVWELCTPPKYTYDGEDATTPRDGVAAKSITAPVAIDSLYGKLDIPLSYGLTGKSTTATTVASLAAKYGWDALTGQIWAVQVAADPGFSGNLHQKGEAAYGPYWSEATDGYHAYDADWTKTLAGTALLSQKGKWRWELNKAGDVVGSSVGAEYVGDYFTMEQHARTSQGTLRRYIDVSSPWSHAYLMEDMSVVGKSDIKDAFSMNNLPAGKDVPKDWWRLF
jgi:hypothetical protein